MLEELKTAVCNANLLLPKYGLVTFTWGNVSGISEDRQYMVIKPSGVPYETMKPGDMVVMNMAGEVVEGDYRPSTDAPTHLELYKKYKDINGVVHTHSRHATEWAQAGRGIPCYGTTHADYFYGVIPCARALTKQEIEEAYEKNTGTAIIEEIGDKDPMDCPGILLKHHGPFAWGKSPEDAVHNAVVMEEVAGMAIRTELINPKATQIPQEIMDKHYFRKHGANAYYGQTKK